MITPEFLEDITNQTENTVRFMQTAILKRICERIESSFLANEERILIPSTITEIHQLMDTGMLIEDIQAEVESALPLIKKEVKDAFLQSAQEISNYNTDIANEIVQAMSKDGPVDIEIPMYEREGLPKSTKHLNMTATEVRKMEQIYKGATRMVEDMCRLLPVQGNEQYLRIATEGWLKAQSGIPITDVIIDSIRRATMDGVKFVSYDSGHIDTIEVAIARAIRTAIAKANAEIVLTRCGEMGVGYVSVSSHMGARVTKELDYTNHSYWQGKVYSLDFKKPELERFDETVPKEEKGFKWLRNMKKHITEKFKKRYDFPDFVEVCGYGQMLGICGINCRHSFYPFFPDVQEPPEQSIDDIDNQRFYEKTQKMRAMERAIRKTKQELYNLRGVDGAEDIVSRLEAKYQRQITALEDYASDNKLPLDSWRLQIARSETSVGVLQSKSQKQKYRGLRS